MGDSSELAGAAPFAPRASAGTPLSTGSAAPAVPDLNQVWTPREMSPRLPDDFRGADMRALMERIYALATQI